MDERDLISLTRLGVRTWLRTVDWAVHAALGPLSPRRDEPPAAEPAEPVAAPVACERARPHEPTLRERGAELLARSADVDDHGDVHPAFARILDELAPDEARVLRLMRTAGPQPAVDVRAGAIPLNSASELVAPGLTMIGAEAGVLHPERVPSYLNNLYRLGLIWFSREPMADIGRYQVLEAQPDVVAALDSKGRSRTVRRSIHLTPFGAGFCDEVLPPR